MDKACGSCLNNQRIIRCVCMILKDFMLALSVNVSLILFTALDVTRSTLCQTVGLCGMILLWAPTSSTQLDGCRSDRILTTDRVV